MIIRNTFLMKRLAAFAFAAFVLCAAMPQICLAQAEKKEPVTFTQKDRDAAIKRFAETQANYANALKGLSMAQMNFKPNEKSWSVGQAAEHIMLSESLILNFIKQAMKTPVNENPGVFRVNDLAVTLAITNRQQKFNAPPAIQPKSESKSIEDLIAGFNKARAVNVEILKTTKVDLRNHFSPNPLMGMIDAYQTFLFLNGHTERHLAQIAEIKANKDFPKN
ncbi:MAG: DinB family protein [Pyrinomonadaceae bacterium]|nr:DinB family protein [Pyrinomonadaceae bacterium]